jgi:Heterokaryon incompatibility protein (HET)
MTLVDNFRDTQEAMLARKIPSEGRSYEALSYVWGPPAFTQRILLDNEPFYITPNLEIALAHLRYPNRERTLWVDATCIDQTNVSERNEQVGYVRKIYSHCAVDFSGSECTAMRSNARWRSWKT